jgi:prepilin-type N-terminal cleavage/methylation domain-containing protein
MASIMKSQTDRAVGFHHRFSPRTMRPNAAAFTLVELLVVIAILALLAMMTFPTVGNIFGSVRSTQCSNNLKEIGKAVRSADVQEGREKLAAMSWQATLSKYLGDSKSGFICPEYAHILSERGETAADVALVPPPLSDLAAFRVNNRWFEDMGEGPFVAKLSDANWNRARADGWLVESGNNFPRGNYQDGSEKNANPYWLCLEDHGNDWDQKDVMVKVTITGAGYLLECMSGSTGHDNWVVDKPDYNELQQIGSRTAFGSKPAIPVQAAGGIVSYGMNIEVPKTLDTPGSILALDYHFIMASSIDDWSDDDIRHPSDRSKPRFARHRELINTVFVDGSVKAKDPYEINPQNSNIRQAYWLP